MSFSGPSSTPQQRVTLVALSAWLGGKGYQKTSMSLCCTQCQNEVLWLSRLKVPTGFRIVQAFLTHALRILRSTMLCSWSATVKMLGKNIGFSRMLGAPTGARRARFDFCEQTVKVRRV